MVLKDIVKVLENADMIRVVKDQKDIYTGYLALFIKSRGIEKYKGLYEKHKNDEVKRFRMIPEVTHRKWREMGLKGPIDQKETPNYKFEDMQIKIYYTIYI